MQGKRRKAPVRPRAEPKQKKSYKHTQAKESPRPKNFHDDLERKTVPLRGHADSNGGHFHAVFDEVDNQYVSVDLTTRTKKGKKGGNNYPLKVDPKTGEKVPEDRYNKDGAPHMRRQGQIHKKSEYKPKVSIGYMEEHDYKQAEIYADRAKEKYLREHKKRK